MSLEELSNTSQPVRYTELPAHIPRQCLGDSSEQEAASQGVMELSESAFQVPKELWRLVEALWMGGAIHEKDFLFSTAWTPVEVIVTAVVYGSESWPLLLARWVDVMSLFTVGIAYSRGVRHWSGSSSWCIDPLAWGGAGVFHCLLFTSSYTYRTIPHGEPIYRPY